MLGAGSVRRAHLLPSGKLIIAGRFSSVGGKRRTNLAQLHPDGALDESFAKDLSLNGVILDMAVQADSKIIIGGFFTQINGRPVPHLARLLPDGSLDTSFRPNGSITSPFIHAVVPAVLVQLDDRILIGGLFETIDGQRSPNIARLHPDGSYDSSFDVQQGASGPVTCMALQADGKVLLGGLFETVRGRNYRRIARLNADGSLRLCLITPATRKEK